jgi:hypothetical protein
MFGKREPHQFNFVDTKRLVTALITVTHGNEQPPPPKHSVVMSAEQEQKLKQKKQEFDAANAIVTDMLGTVVWETLTSQKEQKRISR